MNQNQILEQCKQTECKNCRLVCDKGITITQDNKAKCNDKCGDGNGK